MTHARDVSRVHSVELLISRLLRWGVLLSLALLTAGTAADFARGENTAALRALTGNAGKFAFADLAGGLAKLDGHALIVLGLITLIATPTLRVAVSIIAFAVERDWTFMLITSLVLALLGVSFFVGA